MMAQRVRAHPVQDVPLALFAFLLVVPPVHEP